jgi:hypothetical protein
MQIHRFCCNAFSSARAMTLSVLLLVVALQWPCPLAAAPVPVRFAEGLTHGFVVLRTLNGVLIASGDLLQLSRGREVESRMVFHFKDGSMFDETVVFTQQRVFTIRPTTSYSAGLHSRMTPRFRWSELPESTT